MPEQLVPALIPSDARVPHPSQHARMTPSSAPPLADVFPAPTETTWTYAIARVDRSGRISEQSIVDKLGWAPADHLSLTTIGTGIGVFRRAADGWYRLTSRGGFHVPGPVRARCGIRKGDRLLLAAPEAGDALIFYTMPHLNHCLSLQNDRALRGGQL
ncbi:hypothetical protein ACIRSS_41820 [Amycolatopsis sp. NPDC101161]|uniref:hypothetical protein n=1 Tax=Amycolatopsis sp. NPDC101161 TaxID=3363940 RepID=UPI0038109080